MAGTITRRFRGEHAGVHAHTRRQGYVQLSIGASPDFPGDVRTVVTFQTVGDQTEITITEDGFPDSQIYEFAVTGLEQCLDKMAETFVEA